MKITTCSNIKLTLRRKCRLCAVMAQILSIYGLVASVIMSGNLVEKMALHTGFMQLGAGISVGLCGMAAGFAIGIVGDAGGKYRRSGDRKTRRLTPYHSACKHAAAALVHWHGSHSHFRRSLGPIRCHRLHSHAHEIDRQCHQL